MSTPTLVSSTPASLSQEPEDLVADMKMSPLTLPHASVLTTEARGWTLIPSSPSTTSSGIAIVTPAESIDGNYSQPQSTSGTEESTSNSPATQKYMALLSRFEKVNKGMSALEKSMATSSARNAELKHSESLTNSRLEELKQVLITATRSASANEAAISNLESVAIRHFQEFDQVKKENSSLLDILKVSMDIASNSSATIVQICSLRKRIDECQKKLIDYQQPLINHKTNVSPQLLEENTSLTEELLREQSKPKSSDLHQSQLQKENASLKAELRQEKSTSESHQVYQFPDPETFHWLSNAPPQLPKFIRDCRVKFRFNGQCFPNEDAKIAYVFCHLDNIMFRPFDDAVGKDGCFSMGCLGPDPSVEKVFDILNSKWKGK